MRSGGDIIDRYRSGSRSRSYVEVGLASLASDSDNFTFLFLKSTPSLIGASLGLAVGGAIT
jgi:hypothetical protein